MPNTRISILVALEYADESLKRAVQFAESSFEGLAASTSAAWATANLSIILLTHRAIE